MPKHPHRQTLAGLALATAVLLTTAGCYRDPMTQALPIGSDDSFLNPNGGFATRGAVGTVTGRITDERTRMGVPDVVVEVQNVTPRVFARTDASGNFVLTNVPQGKQILVVNKVEYVYLATQGSIMADVMPNQTVTIPEIVLTPAIQARSNAFMTAIGGLVEPYGLAIDNNRGFLYAIDRIGYSSLVDRRCQVKKFNLTGGFVKAFGGDAISLDRGNNGGKLFDFFGNLNWSYGLDVDTGGNIYVADTNNDRVVKFSTEGDYITKFGDNVKNNFDVAVLNTGAIAVTSAGNNKVLLFDVNLAATSKDFPGTAALPSVNGGLRGVTVDNANFVYLIDTSAGPGAAIKKFDTVNRRPVLQFGSNSGSGPAQFRGATDLAVDNRNGDIYVVDAGNNRVQRFNRDGRFISEFGNAGRANGQFDRPYGIAIDKEGYLYVADSGNRRIQKFAPGQLQNTTNPLNDVNYPTK